MDPPQFAQGWGEDSHARRWWPTRRRADAGNFHPKSALEKQTGADWNCLETGRARPLKVCRREFLSGRKAEKRICYFLAGRRKRIFFLAQGRKRNFLSDRKAERKMCYFLAVPDRQKGKTFKGKRKLCPAENFLIRTIHTI